MAFKASAAADDLKFDLRPFVDVTGIMPEPSYDLRDKFLARIEEVFPEGTNANISVEELRGKEREMIDAVAELSQGTPTAEQLGALPPRMLYAFFGWLVGEISADPTQGNTSG